MTMLGIGIGASALTGIGSALIGSSAAKSAASQQAQAQEQALQLQQNEFNQIQGMEQPYLSAGSQSLGQLGYLLGNGPNTGQGSSAGGYGSLLTPFSASMMQQYSPAYAFQREQGQIGTLAGSSANQGALSGAAQQNLSSFNQGLANTAFNNAFNQYQTQQSNIYDRLAGVANLGQNAASMTGQTGASLAQSEGQSASNIGTALAGGTVGSANALSAGLSNAGNLGMVYALNGGGAPSNFDYNSFNSSIGSPTDNYGAGDASGLGYIPT